MKFILTAALFFLTCSVTPQEPSPSNSQTNYKIIEESESIEDGKMTFVELESMRIKSSDDPDVPVELSASFHFFTKDNKSVVWPSMRITFTSRAAKNRFHTHSPNVTFMLDRKRIEIRGAEALARGGDISASFAEPGVEWLYLDISQETIIALAYAKRVEMRVGQLRLIFQAKHVKGLNELAKRMLSLKAQHNNSLNRSANSIAFMRETCCL